MTGEVDYVDQGKATRKYFDYRMALADEPGEMPECDYAGPPRECRYIQRVIGPAWHLFCSQVR